jgi:hypothetical protein
LQYVSVYTLEIGAYELKMSVSEDVNVSGQVVTAILKDYGAFIFRVKQSRKNLEN